MKKTLTKILSVMLIVCITLTSAPLSELVGLELPEWLDFSFVSKAAEISGKCGENLTWTFDESTGTLTIAGTGEMDSYFSLSSRPWEEYKDKIKEIIINYGVTSIGSYAFTNCTNLVSILIPESIIIIRDEAFNNTGFYNDAKNWENGVLYIDKVLLASNDNVSSKYSIKQGTKVISDDAFFSNKNLTDINIPDSVINVGYSGFCYCQNLTNITISDSVLFIGDRSFYNTAFERDKSNWENGALYLEKYLLDVEHNVTDEFSIKKGTKVIGTYAFNSCNSIVDITVPDSVVNINQGAFSWV